MGQASERMRSTITKLSKENDLLKWQLEQAESEIISLTAKIERFESGGAA